MPHFTTTGIQAENVYGMLSGSGIGVVLNLDLAKLLTQYNNADLRSFLKR